MLVKDVKLDKLTCMGNLKKSYETNFQMLINKYAHVNLDQSMTSFARGQFFSDYEDSVYFEYDAVYSDAMGKRNFKLEFNPSKITDEQKIFLKSNVIPLLSDFGFSRLDLAVDVNANLSDYQFQIFGRSRTYIHSRDGELSTFYIGSRQSPHMIRVYDKNRQLVEKEGWLPFGSTVENEDQKVLTDKVLWRLEFELKGQKIIDFLIQFGFDSVLNDDQRIIRYDFSELNPVDTILAKACFEMPDSFKDLSKKKKWDIRKKLKACGGEDITFEIKKEIKKKNPQILTELEGYTKNSMRLFSKKV